MLFFTKKKIILTLTLATAGAVGGFIYWFGAKSESIKNDDFVKKANSKETIRNGSFTFGTPAPEIPVKR